MCYYSYARRKIMTRNKDSDVLKCLNKELKKYKVKLSFEFYDECPFKENKIEIKSTSFTEVFFMILNGEQRYQ